MPDSRRERSSTPVTRYIRRSEWLRMVSAIAERCSSVSVESSAILFDMSITSCSGVRMAWLMVLKNFSFSLLFSFASSRAFAVSLSVCFRRRCDMASLAIMPISTIITMPISTIPAMAFCPFSFSSSAFRLLIWLIFCSSSICSFDIAELIESVVCFILLYMVSALPYCFCLYSMSACM